MNDSTNNVDDPAVLKKNLTEPPVKKIDLVFPLGMTVTARNIKGVTIKDALDAIHKPFKKKVRSYHFPISVLHTAHLESSILKSTSLSSRNDNQKIIISLTFCS